MTKKKRLTIRLSEDAFFLVKMTETQLGISLSAVIELAVREYAEKQGIKCPS